MQIAFFVPSKIRKKCPYNHRKAMILKYQKNHFLNLIYIKFAGDRQIKIVPLNRAGEITPICIFYKLNFDQF